MPNRLGRTEGYTCFITLPKSAVDKGLILSLSQKALQNKKKNENNKLNQEILTSKILTNIHHTPLFSAMKFEDPPLNAS